MPHRCVSISWGVLEPSENNSLALYLTNETNEPLYCLLTEGQYNPANASEFMILRWSYDASSMGVGSVLRVLLTLSVSHLTMGVIDSSFDVAILASPYVFGNVNLDGHVNILDITILVKTFGSSLGSAVWYPNADVNSDERVNVLDLAIAIKSFGRSV